MNPEIIVAIIAALATILTIVGSFFVTKMTSNSQLKEQQISADREMKRVYYTKFVDAFSRKLFYINKPDCTEKTEAEMDFALEANKLPMYAFEEMLLFIENIKDPQKALDTDITDFLMILRNDLCENTFTKLPSDVKISLTIPNNVICRDDTGNKKIV